MTGYLHWLRSHVQVPVISLVLDQYGAHDTPKVQRTAESLDIELIFVPKGGTGKYQPLDRRVFGALKAKGRAKWSREFARHPGMVCTREMAAGLLLSSWAELSADAVLAGWDLESSEKAGESSSDEDDEEWILSVDDDDSDVSTSSDGDPDLVEDPESTYGYGVT